jgi:hypothetical protein
VFLPAPRNLSASIDVRRRESLAVVGFRRGRRISNTFSIDEIVESLVPLPGRDRQTACIFIRQ